MRPVSGAVMFSALLLLAPTARAQQWGEPPPAESEELKAGGLSPPPPSSQPAQPSGAPGSTERQLERADREDAGRGLEFFWIQGDAGMEWVGLQTLRANGLVADEYTDAAQLGPVFGAGLGLRLVFLTAGARFRFSSFEAWTLWTLNGEVGLHIPLGSLEPYFALGAGYAALGSFAVGAPAGSSDSAVGRVDADIRGWNVRACGGLDWYLSNAFSVGASLSGDLLFLSRPRLAGVQSAGANNVYAASGSSIGAGLSLVAVAGLHF